MNILITGAGGFLGNEISSFLNSKPELNVLSTSRNTLDLMLRDSVRSYLSDNEVDLIIHCAVVGGNRMDPDTTKTYDFNMKMFDNIISEMHSTTRIINFGSGAEFIEKSYYGKSKRHMRFIGAGELKSRYNHLRLYGCFGAMEETQRFITSAMNAYYGNQQIHIHQNKLMDYVYIKDVLNFIYDNLNMEGKEYNLVYKEKYSLYDIAAMVNQLDSHKVPIVVHNYAMGADYISNDCNAEFKNKIGLQGGIKEMRDLRK